MKMYRGDNGHLRNKRSRNIEKRKQEKKEKNKQNLSAAFFFFKFTFGNKTYFSVYNFNIKYMHIATKNRSYYLH